MTKRKLRTPSYLSDLGLVFFCLGADLDAVLDSLGRVSADIPPPDCSPILCLSYSRRTTSGRDGGGWNVTGAFIGAGSSLESVLVFLRPVEFFLSNSKEGVFICFYHHFCNRSFPNYLKPRSQVLVLILPCENENSFTCAPGLALIERFRWTRKWAIEFVITR